MFKMVVFRSVSLIILLTVVGFGGQASAMKSFGTIMIGDCFEGDCLVELEDGNMIPIKNLEKGQRIVSERCNGLASYSTITNIFTTERWSALKILIAPQNENEPVNLVLTSDHFIFATSDPSSISFGRFGTIYGLEKKVAGSLTTEDYLIYKGEFVKIQSITKIEYNDKEIMYSPITGVETIEVNRIYCHCRSQMREINPMFLF